MVPDTELLGRIVGRDREAFGAFYDRHAPILYNLCVRILRDGRDAEDVLQEVFLKVWNDAARFDASRASVRTWLFTIARSRSLDRYRSRKSIERHVVSEADAPLSKTALTSPEPESLLGQHVRQQLAKLTERERELIQLAYYEGYTQEEMAERLGEPLGTVKSRVRSALMKLRSHFSTDGEAQSA